MTVEALENKLNEARTIAFRCNDTFKGMYKSGREDRFGKLIEIHAKGETFLIRNDKETNSTGDIYYRVNNADSLFFEGMVLINSIARAIEDGIIEVIEDYKKPEITVYSIKELEIKTLWNYCFKNGKKVDWMNKYTVKDERDEHNKHIGF